MKPPWWAHWYVAAAVVPIFVGVMMLIVMGVQRLAVGSSNFYVATLQKAGASPVVVSALGNDLEVKKVVEASVPLFGGETKLVLWVKGSRAEGQIVAVGHADTPDDAQMTRFFMVTQNGPVPLLGRKHPGLGQ